jgi:hypothetical protein
LDFSFLGAAEVVLVMVVAGSTSCHPALVTISMAAFEGRGKGGPLWPVSGGATTALAGDVATEGWACVLGMGLVVIVHLLMTFMGMVSRGAVPHGKPWPTA